MRIIHCAPFNIFTKTGGALYSNSVKISLGLVENGHFVHNFDYRDSSRYFSIFKNKKNGSKKMNQLFLKVIDEISPDLIIFGHAEMIDLESFKIIKNKNIKMMFWYNDMIIDEHFIQVADLFDAVFITGEGLIIDQLRKLNTKSFFLPNPVNKNIEKFIGFRKIQNYDILFSGRKDGERKKLIDYMQNNLSNLNIKYIGQTSDTTIIGNEYFDLIINSKICLNHSRDEYMVNKWYTSDRLMHILGNGSYCISRKIINGEDFFEDKLDYYTNYDELKNRILENLENKELRIQKTEWLYNRVHSLFNSKKVGAYMIDILHEDNTKLKEYEWYK